MSRGKRRKAAVNSQLSHKGTLYNVTVCKLMNASACQ